MILSSIYCDSVTLSTHQFLVFLIIGLLCMATAILLLFKPKFPAAVVGYIGLLSLHASTYIYLTTNALIFWGIATVIVGILHAMLPKGEPANSRASNIYIAWAGLAGTVLGLAIHANVMVIGSIIGTFVGLLAYTRTPKGAWLKFPTFTFIQYFCAKGLSAIVALAIMGIALEGFIVK